MRAAVLVLAVAVTTVLAGPWDELTTIMDQAIADGAFPGGVGIVATQDKILYSAARGHFTYGVPAPASGDNPAVTLDTIWDMASVSKVMAGTAAAAILYQAGHLDLNTPVNKILPGYESNGKGETTVLHLLVHAAGIMCDPVPGYYQKPFGCPEVTKVHPAMTFSCLDQTYKGMITEKLINPINSKYVYCDTCLMLMGHVCGRVAKQFNWVKDSDVVRGCPLTGEGRGMCYFEAFVRKFVFQRLGLKNTMFNPPKALWRKIAPTENDTWYRNRVVQGEIHDENTYAMGGFSGHAGVFSTAMDLVEFARRWMFATPSGNGFVNATTSKYFTTQVNHTQSSRAIGWNTQDPTARGGGDGGLCGSLSPTTYLHSGFTGTLVCADPERKLIVVFLNNRIYTTRENWKVNPVNRNFTTAVQRIFDSLNS